MAIGTTSTWRPNRDRAITNALRLCGELNAGQDADADQLSLGYEFLQSGLLALHTEGVILQMVERYEQSLSAVTASAPYVTAPSDTEEVLPGAMVRDSNGQELPLEVYSQRMYLALITDKTGVSGQPTVYYPEKQTTDAIRIYIYPIPDTDYETLIYMRHRRFRDTDTGSTDIDVPVRWMQAIEFMLAWKFSLHYRPSRADYFERRWEVEKARCMAAESPAAPLSFCIESLFGD